MSVTPASGPQISASASVSASRAASLSAPAAASAAPPSHAASPAGAQSPPPLPERSFRDALLATLGIAFVVMLVALDQTIVATALPTIVAELQGFRLYAWVATSYLLTSVVTIPIFGRLGDDFGRKPFVFVSIVIFTLASMLCGLATSMPFLIIARGLQGIGGGMLVGTAFASIPDLFPSPQVRMRWQVILSSAYGIANAVGPTLGGWLTESFGWRAVFFVNLPIGLISLVFVWRFLPWVRHRQLVEGQPQKVRLDWLGALLLGCCLVALQLVVTRLQAGQELGALGMAGIALASGVCLWFHERRATHPILPLTMFADVRLSSLFVLALLSGFTLFSLLFYAPLLFQGGFGLLPGTAGALVTPLVVCITLGSITNGRVVTRLRNPNVMLTLGFSLLTLGCLGMTMSSRAMPTGMITCFMACSGLGLGWVLPNLTVFGQEQAGRQLFGTVTAMVQSLRMIGGMMGTALTGALVSHLYQRHVHSALASQGLEQWYGRFSNPQILVDAKDQTRLVAQIIAAGHNGVATLDLARGALVSSVHAGIVVATLVAVWGIWQTRKVPPIRFARRVKDGTPAAAASAAAAGAGAGASPGEAGKTVDEVSGNNPVARSAEAAAQAPSKASRESN